MFDELEIIKNAYLAILKSPSNDWRIEQGMNGTLAEMRDYIAHREGRTAQSVQDEYEKKAKQF